MLWTSEQNEQLSRYCVGIQAISAKVRLGHADYADAAALEFVLPQLAKAVEDLRNLIIKNCQQRDSYMQEEAANDTLDSNA